MNKPSALDRFRAAAAQREKEAKKREAEMKARHAQGKEDMKGAIDTLASRFEDVKESQAHDEGHRDRWYHRKANPKYEPGSQEHKDYMDAYTGKHKQKLLGTKTFDKHGNEVVKESYEEAEEHMSKANDADAKGDKKAFHTHMADYHDAMSSWHDSKGRSASADKHAEKADYHHQKSLETKEEVEIDEATDLRAQLQKHSDAAIAANRAGDDEKVKHHMNKMNAIKDKMAKQVRNEETELEEARSTAERLAVAKQMYDNAMRSARTPAERAQAKETYDNVVKRLKEEVAANNVGGGNIAGTQGDAGKKAVMTKEPLKRKKLTDFKEWIEEATYQGREVKLNKPMPGDVKKSKVYVDPDGDGKAKKVEFGDPNMSIKKHIPARRRSFRARHNCDNPGPKDKARYWSCKAW